MIKPTKKEIEDAAQELLDAMLEYRSAEEEEDKAKLKKVRAQKRLSMAREEIRAINIYNH